MTVTTFSVNEFNDLFLDSRGNIAISHDLDALLFICAQVAKTQLGECVLNTNLGIPNFQVVWNGVPNIIQFEAALREAILAIDGVIEISSLMTEIIDNQLKYSMVIRTNFGGGIVSG